MGKKVLVFILIATTFTSGIRIDVPVGGGSVNVNLTQLFAIFLSIYLVSLAALKRKPIPLFYKDWPSLFIYGYLLSNIFSSIVFSGDPLKALKSCLAIAVYVNIYHVGRWLIEEAKMETGTTRQLETNNILSALIGFCGMVASILLGEWENMAVSLGHVGDGVPSIRSLSFEPNVFAITTSVALCISIAIYMYQVKQSRIQFSILLFLGLCVLFAYTRSAYVSLTFAILLMLKLTGRINWKILLNISAFILLVLIANQFLSDDNFIKQAILSKTENLVNFSEGNGLGRVTTFLVGWAGFMVHPFFGNGTMMADTASLNIFTGELEDVMGTPGWLSGSLIQSLHDTGVIGALIILGIFISFSMINLKNFRREENIERKALFLGFFAANIIIAITSQITSVLWIGFPFVFWAINMAYISKVTKKKKLTDKSPNQIRL